MIGTIAAAGAAGAASSWLSSAAAGALLGGSVAALGGLGNSVINSYSASHSASKSYHYSKKLYDYQMRRSLLDAPKMQMQGLRDAGINPIASYGNIGYNGSMPSFNAPTFQGDLDTSLLGRGVAELPSAFSELRTQEQNRRIQQGQFDLNVLNSTVQNENSSKIASAEVEELRSRSLLNQLRSVSELEIPKKTKSEVSLLLAQKAKAEGDTVSPEVNRNKVLAETRKIMADRWHTMKSKVYADAGGWLVRKLGFSAGAEVYLGDVIDLGVSLGMTADEILSGVAPEKVKASMRKKPSVHEMKPKKKDVDLLERKTGIKYQSFEGSSAKRLKSALNWLD